MRTTRIHRARLTGTGPGALARVLLVGWTLAGPGRGDLRPPTGLPAGNPDAPRAAGVPPRVRLLDVLTRIPALARSRELTYARIEGLQETLWSTVEELPRTTIAVEGGGLEVCRWPDTADPDDLSGVAGSLAAGWPDIRAFMEGWFAAALPDPVRIVLVPGIDDIEGGRTGGFSLFDPPRIVILVPPRPACTDRLPGLRTTLIHEISHIHARTLLTGPVPPPPGSPYRAWLSEGLATLLGDHALAPAPGEDAFRRLREGVIREGPRIDWESLDRHEDFYAHGALRYLPLSIFVYLNNRFGSARLRTFSRRIFTYPTADLDALTRETFGVPIEEIRRGWAVHFDLEAPCGIGSH